MSIVSHVIPQRFRRSLSAPRFLEGLCKCETVVGGPFRGIRYHGEAVCSASSPKLLGVYEIELEPVLLDWARIPFQQVIDVGAAEGHYAVGCAKLWPQTNIIAFESTQEGRLLLQRMVELNRLQSRIKIMGHCEEEQLREALTGGKRTLIIMDVEGGEGQLLNPESIPGLTDAHIIVEI